VNFVPGDGVIISRRVYDEHIDDKVFRLDGRGEDVDFNLRMASRGVPLRAIIETHSVHPDTGIYEPTVQNLIEHLQHAYFWGQAHYGYGQSLWNLFMIVLSVLTVPLMIYLEDLPRGAEAFARRTSTLRNSR